MNTNYAATFKLLEALEKDLRIAEIMEIEGAMTGLFKSNDSRIKKELAHTTTKNK